jgi:hypothetical protein
MGTWDSQYTQSERRHPNVGGGVPPATWVLPGEVARRRQPPTFNPRWEAAFHRRPYSFRTCWSPAGASLPL